MRKNMDSIKSIAESFADIAEHANYIGYLSVHVEYSSAKRESVVSFVSIFDSGIIARKFTMNIPLEIAYRHKMTKGELIRFEKLPLDFLAFLAKKDSDIGVRALSYFR